MAEVKVNVKVEQISPKVLEIRTIVKGKFYMRRYMGVNKKEAMKMFGKWLETQI